VHVLRHVRRCGPWQRLSELRRRVRRSAHPAIQELEERQLSGQGSSEHHGKAQTRRSIVACFILGCDPENFAGTALAPRTMSTSARRRFAGMRLIGNAAVYWVWALLVVVALVSAYFVDPYVFAFTTLILGVASCLVGVSGLAVVVFSKTTSHRRKVSIAAALVIAAVAIVISLEILGGFNWA
jgi:hypothetical protein